MSMGLEALLANRTEIDAELRKNKSPVTVMFTDLAGSTAFFDQFGDTAGVQWIEEHNTIVFPQVKAHEGTIVKTIGDSVMAHFPSPAKAVQAGAAILRSLQAANQQKEPKDRMYVRVALHHGLGYLRGGDVFGDVVNVAARIAKKCLPGQILVSEAVYLNAHETAGMAMNAVGSVQFRGKTNVEQLYEAMWIDEAAYAELRALFPEKKSAEAQEDFTGGRYVIQTELGRGAMGVVYKAYDRVIGRTVALKTIPLEVEESERAALVQRLKKEAQTAGALDHPGIVTVFDAGDEAGVFYFTMLYVDGRPLSDLRASRELLPLDKIYDICEQMLDAMTTAHAAGVIHRDLKPSNMMLTAKGQVKIMDFGIAKFGESGLTKAGMVLGTPSYLAPEQAAGRRIDHRADIFSLGAIAYEMFTGERAFPGESTTSIIYKVLNDEPIPPRAIEPSLSPAVDAVICKALAKDPLQRFKNCNEFLEALRASKANPETVIDAPVSTHAPPATAQTSQRTVSTGAATAVAPARTMAANAQTMAATMYAEPPKSKTGLYVGAAVVAVALLGAGGYFAMAKKQPTTQPSAQVLVQQPPPPAQTTTATSEPVNSSTTSSPAEPQKSKTTHPLRESAATGAVPEGNQATAQAPANDAPTQPLTRRELRREKIREAIAANNSNVSQGASQPANDGAGAAPAGMWTRDDIPDLLKKADVYSGRGEYGRAIATYREILRIDGGNAAARDGLQKAREAQQLRR